MKSAKNMDGSTEMKLPSMKTADNMDDSTKTKLPSMILPDFMDGRYEKPRKWH